MWMIKNNLNIHHPKTLFIVFRSTTNESRFECVINQCWFIRSYHQTRCFQCSTQIFTPPLNSKRSSKWTLQHVYGVLGCKSTFAHHVSLFSIFFAVPCRMFFLFVSDLCISTLSYYTCVVLLNFHLGALVCIVVDLFFRFLHCTTLAGNSAGCIELIKQVWDCRRFSAGLV